MHDAFAAAMETWPESGVPDNPAAWLMRVARRRALDELRRMRRARDRDDGEADPAIDPEASRSCVARSPTISCACCRRLPPVAQPGVTVALTLRTLCGFEVENLARALLADPAAMEKRLVRARQTLRAEQVAFDLPPPDERAARTGAVLRALYVLFSEGYSARAGDEPIRAELCRDAIRLVELLVAEDSPLAGAPAVRALAALMLLLAARLPARVDSGGNLLLLSEQDRSRWDRGLIARGMAHLSGSAEGDEVTEYHLEAGIAACHALAPSCADTEWRRIVGYYDRLLELNSSPVIRLNRAIAVGYAEGPEQGLDELARLEREPRLEEYGLLRAARADLHARLGDTRRAREAYERAIELCATEPERRLLRRRLAELA